MPSNVNVIDAAAAAAGSFVERGAAPPDDLATQEASKPFVVYQEEFLELLGPNPTMKLVAKHDDYPFAHEGPVWIEKTREVFFTSNQFYAPGSKKKQINIGKISIPPPGSKEADPSSTELYKWETVNPQQTIVTSNGAVNYKDGILVCSQGHDDVTGALVHMTASPPYSTKVILSNFNGRPFNAPNDVVILPFDGSIWFTDPSYAQRQGLRKERKLPNQVYCYHPDSGALRVVADGIVMPNGIAFSHDYKTCYITDTDTYSGTGNMTSDTAATIYAYSVVVSPGSRAKNPPYVLVNRRVFAFGDCGAPDGIKCDTKGNVYSGCMDGISVWNSDGILIGKILADGGVANFCFTDDGRLIVLNETRIFDVRLSPDTIGALLN